jgi:hypothetical protein
MNRKYSYEALTEAVKTSTSISQVIKKLGNKGCGGGTYACIKNNIKKLGLDTSHFLGQSWLRGKSHDWNSKPISSYLVNGNKRVHSDFLKKRLIQEGIWKNECHVCGIEPFWNEKPLSLQIHHMNGNSHDNRLENIRMECPNCHTQTPNFSGRSLRKKRKSEINPKWRCAPRPKKRKVNRPSKEELSALINEKPWTHIAKTFGVTDNAVRKWARCYGLMNGPVA